MQACDTGAQATSLDMLAAQVGTLISKHRPARKLMSSYLNSTGPVLGIYDHSCEHEEHRTKQPCRAVIIYLERCFNAHGHWPVMQEIQPLCH